MTLKDIVTELELEVLVGSEDLSATVTGGYTSDLLSDVIGHAREHDVWITLQTHQNIIAVARLKEIAGIILVGGRRPDPETLSKAEQEKIAVFTTRERAFSISGKLYAMLERNRETS